MTAVAQPTNSMLLNRTMTTDDMSRVYFLAFYTADTPEPDAAYPTAPVTADAAAAVAVEAVAAAAAAVAVTAA